MEIIQNIAENAQDTFAINLANSKLSLLKCQDSKGFKSCLNCPSIFECSIREQYVNDVYKFMNKGQSGEFDFA